MKTSAVVSAILIVLFSIILVTGIILNPETSIRKSITIEAPETVVWAAVTGPNEYSNWYKSIRQIEFYPEVSLNKSLRVVDYSIIGRELKIKERIEIYESSDRITFTQIDTVRKSLIHNIRQSIVLEALPDGSTEAIWEITYMAPPVLSKLMDFIIVRPAFNELINLNLSSLKNYIER
ncbi:MAG: SRPBCC family protein [Calditrichaceae bacterium]